MRVATKLAAVLPATLLAGLLTLTSLADEQPPAAPIVVAQADATADPSLDDVTADADAADAAEAEEVPTLLSSMESMGQSLRKLRRAVRDPQEHPEALLLVNDMQKQVLIAKSMIPPMTQTLEESKRDQFLIDYRKRMVGLMRTQLELELALIDGDAEKAGELVKQLLDERFQGHKDFKEEQRRQQGGKTAGRRGDAIHPRSGG